MRSCLALLALALFASGCGSGGGNERKNDPGPKIEMNPGGPGAMRPPGDGGKPGLPEQMQTPKK